MSMNYQIVHIGRSARTGRFTSIKQALRFKKTHVVETIRIKKRKTTKRRR